MQKIFCMYNLKVGAKMEEFKKWSKQIDQRALSRQKGIKSFEVYEIKRAEKAEPPYKILDVIEGESYQAFQKALQTDEMKKSCGRVE